MSKFTLDEQIAELAAEDEPSYKTHPGFEIRCRRCSSVDCYFDNTMGWSSGSGGWGEFTLICNSCDLRVDLIRSY